MRDASMSKEDKVSALWAFGAGNRALKSASMQLDATSAKLGHSPESDLSHLGQLARSPETSRADYESALDKYVGRRNTILSFELIKLSTGS